MKKALLILLAIVLLAAAIGGFFLYRHASTTIGKTAALQVALSDAGLEKKQVRDIDIEYEHGWYEIDFESGKGDFFYRIDARTGEILSGGYDD